MNKIDDLRKNTKVGVIIPTLNEEAAIGEELEKIKDALKDYNFDITVSDGRSSDNTVKIALQHGAKTIYQKKKGYGDALLAGYLFSIEELHCEILINLDADGTYDAYDIPKMLDKILLGETDYVVGKRTLRPKSMKPSHIFGNKVISFLIRKLLHVKVSDSQSGLFGFRSYLINKTDSWHTTGWAFNTELLTKAAQSDMKIIEMETSYKPRIGTAHISILGPGIANIVVILRMIIDFQPLMLLGIFGTCFFIVGIIIGGAVIYEFLMTNNITRPNTATLAAVFIITGIQIFSLGLVADMIKRRTLKRIRPLDSYYFKE